MVKNVNIATIDAACNWKAENLDEVISKSVLAKSQVEDEVIAPVYECVKNNQKPKKDELKQFSPESRILLKQWSKLYIEEKVLKRKTNSLRQLVLPHTQFSIY